jgi:hypothetical protein
MQNPVTTARRTSIAGSKGIPAGITWCPVQKDFSVIIAAAGTGVTDEPGLRETMAAVAPVAPRMGIQAGCKGVPGHFFYRREMAKTSDIKYMYGHIIQHEP